ncbi:MAG: aminotransferase class I/II-fold pyridoxal phosphate-dependent enzyme [Victivallales bacterium]|nr:aminotransferase class I/II-fold pyridoxal phosphate-dependent enzyme [Victivallales bacterium]
MNKYSNILKMINLADVCWQTLLDNNLSNVIVNYKDGKYYTDSGHSFYNMVSVSYLGLETSEIIKEEECKTLKNPLNINIPTSKLRIKSKLFYNVEKELSEYFDAIALLGSSCSALSEGILPLIASGALTNNIKPLMIFDQFCHFSMNITKPGCGDETKVVTAKHNDMDFLEEACKNNDWVAYIADGAYSMGGHTPMEKLVELQKKYNLFLYIDDSHSLTAYGDKGYGYVRSFMKEINEKTIFTYSLYKSFGAAGGMSLVNKSNTRNIKLIERYAGPIAWSQPPTVSALGRIKGSLKVHRTEEINIRQQRLNENLELFDSLVETAQKGSKLPIRLVLIGNEESTLKVSKNLFDNGFYVSAVFFPIVQKGKAGLRVMMNSEIDKKDLKKLCSLINENLLKYK